MVVLSVRGYSRYFLDCGGNDMEYIEAYKDFLKNGKTERECVVQFLKMA